MRQSILRFGTAAKLIGSVSLALMLIGIHFLGAQAAPIPQTPVELVNAMTARERSATARHERFAYLSTERSERTGGHLWTERVAEVAQGHVRLLIAEDGKPLSSERQQTERGRLASDIARPDDFAHREQADKADELRARSLLDKLPTGFVLENVRLEGSVWKVDFRPDGGYSASGMEDRVLHDMRGTIVIDARDLRLIHLDGHMQDNMSFGFGLLATLRSGSNFAVDKQDEGGNWRAVHMVTDIRGKAILFKTIARSTDWSRTNFQHLDPNMSVAEAVALVER